MNGKVPYVELSDGDAQQTNAMYKCNGKILHDTASSPGKFALSEWVEEAWNWSSTKVCHIQTRRGGLSTRLLLSISNNNAQVEIVSGKLPTYPSPKPTFCPKWEVSVDVGLGEGWVGSFSETYNENLCFIWPSILTLSLLCIFQRAFFRGTGKNYSTWRAGGLYLMGQPSVKKMTKCLKVWGKIPLVATRIYLIVGCL